MIEWVVFVISLAGLYYGAEWLIRGALRIAYQLHVSPMFVGLTIVAFGTSLPELIVSILASFSNQGNLAVGNVVGSNICNIGLILGLSAVIRPLRIQLSSVQKDVPLLIATSLAGLWVISDKRISLWEGLFLFAGLVAFVFFNYRQSRNAKEEVLLSELPERQETVSGKMGIAVLWVLAGGIFLSVSAKGFIWSALAISRSLGLPDTFIALTLVSVGTSLPELATSVVAAFKGNSDIAVGNVVGSNLFNLLGILGITAILHPIVSEGIHLSDLLVMCGLSALVLPFIRSRFRLERWEGGILLLIYGIYVILLV